ncbi:HAMP domain-containing protein [Sinorhizobium meliloti]|uniref:sensor histidine kinase n=1 Tax=Rhizobium meliloti TaxID=382 RepID=UPI000FD8E498|nr:ATP-binding protein [Sinorhizobium meliloti]RVP09916.1 HAMP domain-containing protein [Sinorhizobium meliloti]
MASFTLARRLSSIVLVSLLGIWLILVISSYIGHDWQEENFQPSPERLAAITDAIENASPQERASILKALSSPTLKLRIETRTDKPPTEPTRRTDEEIVKRYADALGGRAFTASRFQAPVSQSDIFQLGWRTRHAIEFRIGMTTGETLIIDNVAPIVATSFGVPVGVGAGFVGTMVALVALVVMYREIRPLTQLARAVDRIDLENNPISLPDVRNQSAEIRALVTAFDRLQTRLSQLLRARMAMLAGISHDVRTFATRLRLRVDAIPDEHKRERAISDISDMIRMLDDALLAARVGSGELSEELIELAVLTKGEVNDRSSTGMPVELSVVRGAENVMVLGDPLALRRVIGNLIENAVNYGASAHVTVSASTQHASVMVEDQGPGISENMIDMLIEPFVRGEASRNRDTGGAGLGLAIARNLIEAHGGSLKIEKLPVRGSRIGFEMPRFVG